MPQNPRNLSTDLRGVGNLTVDAVLGVTDIVESLHATILSFGGVLGSPGRKRTNGITGLVYRNIRTVTELVGAGIDAPFNHLGQILGENESSPGREAVLSALNGVLGDHLVARNNPLAIPMQLRRHGKPLSEKALTDAIQQSNGRLAVLVHGACLNDLQWHRKGHDHGAALARDLDIAPIYVNYNTGLHVSENGRSLAARLELLFNHTPPPKSLTIIAHSMGGLVARSAYHYGQAAGHTWPDQLQKLVFLGTPHHGAPLEKGAIWINYFMEISPYSAPFSRLGKIRSSGLTDLRFGNMAKEDWQGRDRFDLATDQRRPIPLPAGTACYALAATTSNGASQLGDNLVGDGLVPVKSALGQHRDAELNLIFPESRQWLGHNMNHLDLLNHPEVYETLKTWLAT